MPRRTLDPQETTAETKPKVRDWPPIPNAGGAYVVDAQGTLVREDDPPPPAEPQGDAE